MGQFFAQKSVSGSIPLTLPGSSCFLPLDAVLLALGASGYTGTNTAAGTVVDTYKSSPTGIAFASGVNETPGLMIMKRDPGHPTSQRAPSKTFTPVSALIQWGFDLFFNPSGSGDFISLGKSATIIAGTYKLSTITKTYSGEGVVTGLSLAPAANAINGGYPVSPNISPFGGSGFSHAGQSEFLLSSIAPELGVITQFDATINSNNIWDLSSYFANTGAMTLASGGQLFLGASVTVNYVIDIPDSYFVASGNTDDDYWIRLSDCVPSTRKLTQPTFADTSATMANNSVALGAGTPAKSLNSIMGCLSSFASTTSKFTAAPSVNQRIGMYNNGAGAHYDCFVNSQMTLSRGSLTPQFYGANFPGGGVTNGPY